jgi:hypothetical protein
LQIEYRWAEGDADRIRQDGRVRRIGVLLTFAADEPETMALPRFGRGCSKRAGAAQPANGMR